MKDSIHFYQCEYEKQQGLFPVDYLLLSHHEFYVGQISERGADNLLRGEPKGTFLVREQSPG